MAVAFRSASIGANLSTSLPSGHASGDVLIALVSTETNGTTPTAATGWTLILGDTTTITGGRPLSAHCYWIARGGSAPATNWSTGGADASQVGYLCYTGVDTTSPIDASVHNEDGAGGSSTVVWSAITVATDQSMMVGLAAINQWNSCTVAQWTNERADGAGTIAAHLFDDGLKGTGSTGTKTETIGAGWHTFTLALKPASGGSDVDVDAGNAAATGAANTAKASVAPTGPNAAATAAANAASISTKPNAAVGGAAGAANAPTVSVSVNAGVAAASAAANAPTVSAGADQSVNAGNAAATGAANAPTAGVSPSSGVGAATGAANAPTVSVSVNAGVAAATGAANAPTVAVAPNAGNAAATGAALQPTISSNADRTADAGHAAASSAANAPTISVSVNAGVATATASALLAAASIGPSAGHAAATATGHQPSLSIKVNAGVGAATAAALQPVASGGGEPATDTYTAHRYREGVGRGYTENYTAHRYREKAE